MSSGTGRYEEGPALCSLWRLAETVGCRASLIKARKEGCPQAQLSQSKGAHSLIPVTLACRSSSPDASALTAEPREQRCKISQGQPSSVDHLAVPSSDGDGLAWPPRSQVRHKDLGLNEAEQDKGGVEVCSPAEDLGRFRKHLGKLSNGG